ncbi:MAG: thioredoxin family protein, partial [Phycisphaerae bacterium]|nr:thioredoxin family protein [Phycisphaerae bacterium]
DRPNATDSPRSAGAVPVGALLLIAALAVMGWLLFGPGPNIGDWHEQIDPALAAATESRRPVLVYFTADWCPPCRSFKKNVLTRKDVQDYLSANFEQALVDLSDRRGPNNFVAQRYGVRSIPTLLVLTPEGGQVQRQAGGFDSPRFLAWLKRSAPAGG